LQGGEEGKLKIEKGEFIPHSNPLQQGMRE